jgi:signal transduction histidine kinase/CheY-like chemotaxis protein
MASNIAYIAFVMALLGITRKRATKLHFAGLAAMVILASFWLIVPFMPNMSLEFARYGVAVFGLFGITSGIIMAIKGQKTARYYLIANVAFLIPGLMSIALQSLPNSTLFIEHLGLFAVAMEVVLLSLVLSYQLSVVYKEKSANLIATQEALAIADNAVKTKERFLANISHELRTPLNAIQGSVDLLSGQHISAEGKDHIEIIRHSSAFLLFLINDILDLAKLNADMLLIEKRAFNLRDMVTQICSIYGSSFTVNSKAEFKLIIDDNVPLYIYGDERRMEQVIANLLSNAFKFTDAGTVTFKLTTIDNGQYLKFSVQDSGIGIDPENLSSMFSAFTQADSSISRKYGGTGLGLRIASRIVELMGGEMSAASQPGQGSEFWFTVPLSIANETQATNTQTEVGSQDLTFPDLHVMVVDDNAVNLKVINAMLKRLETKVTAFNNAHDAVNFAEKDGVDLVIMDVQMPEVDGLTASQQLRESGFNKPIIAFTANASEKDQIACYEAGMNDILIKPIKLQNLIDSLRKWRTRS